jgi:hypothetical protein
MLSHAFEYRSCSLKKGFAQFRLSYDAVNAKSSTDRDVPVRMQALPPCILIHGNQEVGSKSPRILLLNATGVKESDRPVQHVPERYLDDRDDLKSTCLQCLPRLRALPVNLMRSTGSEQ